MSRKKVMDCGSCIDLSSLISKPAAAKEAVMSARVSPKDECKNLEEFEWTIYIEFSAGSLRTNVVFFSLKEKILDDKEKLVQEQD